MVEGGLAIHSCVGGGAAKTLSSPELLHKTRGNVIENIFFHHIFFLASAASAVALSCIINFPLTWFRPVQTFRRLQMFAAC